MRNNILNNIYSRGISLCEKWKVNPHLSLRRKDFITFAGPRALVLFSTFVLLFISVSILQKDTNLAEAFSVEEDATSPSISIGSASNINITTTGEMVTANLSVKVETDSVGYKLYTYFDSKDLLDETGENSIFGISSEMSSIPARHWGIKVPQNGSVYEAPTLSSEPFLAASSSSAANMTYNIIVGANTAEVTSGIYRGTAHFTLEPIIQSATVTYLPNLPTGVNASTLSDMPSSPQSHELEESQANITLSSKIPAISTDLYLFCGWSTKSSASCGDASVHKYTDEDNSFLLTATHPNVVFYAIWQSAAKYTIKFNRNGASFDVTGTVPASIEVSTGGTFTFPENTLSYNNNKYIFNGWSTNSTATIGFKPGETSEPVYDSATYYAVWVRSETTRCAGDNICFLPNNPLPGEEGTTVEGTMKYLSVTTNSATFLYPSNYSRDGYGFAGWNTERDGSGTSYGPMEYYETPSSIDTGGIPLYAHWIPAERKEDGELVPLQDWKGCSSLGVGNVTALTDYRDGDTYAVAKLADGNCWMIENLRLDNDALANDSGEYSNYNGLGVADAPVFIGLPEPNNVLIQNWTSGSSAKYCYYFSHYPDSNFTRHESFCNNSLYGSTTSYQYRITGGVYTSRIPRYNSVNTKERYDWTNDMTTKSYIAQNTYSYGNYYNWPAAVASTELTSTLSVKSSSICPRGWRIPISTSAQANNDTSISFARLLAAVNGKTGENYDNTNTTRRNVLAYPTNFVLSGYASQSNYQNRGSTLKYWASNTASSGDDQTSARVLQIDLTSAYPISFTYNYKSLGLPIRCAISGE